MICMGKIPVNANSMDYFCRGKLINSKTLRLPQIQQTTVCSNFFQKKFDKKLKNDYRAGTSSPHP